MPKRARLSDEEDSSEQALKKQVSCKNDNIKIREIKSLSAEKTLNILFNASSKRSADNKVSLPLRCSCSNKDKLSSRCFFCDKMICSNCLRPCDMCEEIFCENCSFLLYDEQYDCVCYSCMNNK